MQCLQVSTFTIHFYKEACDDANYEPLSDSTLYKILHNLKPSQRKSSTGLDGTTAAAMNGYDMLQKDADKTVADQLERGKRYLKTHYQIHCSQENSNICTHSTYFALSDHKNKQLVAKSLHSYARIATSSARFFRSAMT